jgi:hypothetical protein
MGREVVCRVVSRDPLEGVVTVAMKQSILDLAFLRREDIPIGKKLKVRIPLRKSHPRAIVNQQRDK